MSLRFKGNIGTKGTLKGKIVPVDILLLDYKASSGQTLTEFPGIQSGSPDAEYIVQDTEFGNNEPATYIDSTTKTSTYVFHILPGYEGRRIRSEVRMRKPSNHAMYIYNNSRRSPVSFSSSFNTTNMYNTQTGQVIAPMPANSDQIYYDYAIVSNLTPTVFEVEIDQAVVGTSSMPSVNSSYKFIYLNIDDADTFVSNWKVTVLPEA